MKREISQTLWTNLCRRSVTNLLCPYRLKTFKLWLCIWVLHYNWKQNLKTESKLCFPRIPRKIANGENVLRVFVPGQPWMPDCHMSWFKEKWIRHCVVVYGSVLLPDLRKAESYEKLRFCRIFVAYVLQKAITWSSIELELNMCEMMSSCCYRPPELKMYWWKLWKRLGNDLKICH